MNVFDVGAAVVGVAMIAALLALVAASVAELLEP